MLLTHADGSGRLQTVYQETNPRYHGLISAFNDITGAPMVLNNRRGQAEAESMAKSVIWSEEALYDIECIAEYISRDSVYYAQQVVERIIGTGESVNGRAGMSC